MAILMIMSIAPLSAQKLLIPMDLSQTDHLKAYGLAYWGLTKNIEIDWLLNYRAGSFIMDYADNIAAECRIRGVYFEQIDGATASQIYSEVQGENTNMDAVRLEKPPKIAVYTPPGSRPWDDAVTLANGDVLTGSIKTMADGKVTINSPVLGDVTVPMASITPKIHKPHGFIPRTAWQEPRMPENSPTDPTIRYP